MNSDTVTMQSNGYRKLKDPQDSAGTTLEMIEEEPLTLSNSRPE